MSRFGLSRVRVLFVAESVTLAHLARPFALAEALDPAGYEVHLATAGTYLHLLRDHGMPVHPIHSISPAEFQAALAQGKPLHTAATLRAYVQEDIALLERVQPDVVVGDLRHSLGISARVTRVPYISLVNAYWSPYARHQYPIPEIPLTKLIGVRAAQSLFNLFRPFAFASHCEPLNQVRKEHGLPPVGKDITLVYNDADYVLYPETPALVPTYNRPDTHRYAGPIHWSPAVDLPSWWHAVPRDQPIVYVTLGSSGAVRLLQPVLAALADQPVSVLLASLGHDPGQLPANVFVSDYLPGTQAAARSALVISNGGSPTSYQALAAGVPVLGIPSNLDQHMCMLYIQQAGAGLIVRSEQASKATIARAVQTLLRDGSYRERAAQLAQSFAPCQPAEELAAIVRSI